MVTKNKAFRYLLFFSAFLLLSSAVFAQELDGYKLFQQNCGACHKADADYTGPALQPALDNWDGDKEAMYTWVRNWGQAVELGEGGDPRFARAVEVQDYDASAMNLFPTLDDAKLDAIFAWVANPVTPGGGVSGGEVTAPVAQTGINWLLVGVLALLLILSLILARISQNVEKLIYERDGDPLPEPVSLKDRILNKKLLGFLSLLAFGFLGYSLYVNAANLGRSQGYAPEQPIAFSHKLHAGTLEINCQYCHSSAAVSKSASIPSMNICMNCHKQVEAGPTGETQQIAKIYEATGWNTETLAYDLEPGAPIEWDRIHNLPDHVFFSHAQHVSAGGIECQTCHGPVEEMEVLTQYSNLSMGWCINCHRETKVQFEDNAYYADTFKEYHKNVKDGKLDFVTVETIGGLECQKCHY
ncbi:MAG: c-type cytochrome [Saprospiraceae bacterium]|nr:c-type cytochrome [Saprospiraceae bacterium]